MKRELALVLGMSLGVVGPACAQPATVLSATATDQTSLLGAEWLIEEIGDGGVIDGTQASLQFLPEGRLTGNATCNRIMGRYEDTAGTLVLKLEGTTKMSCPEALMQQEQKLMALLPTVKSYRIDDNRTLVLTTASGKTITARR